MGHGSVADFAVRLERHQRLRETSAQVERKMWRAKLAELTAQSYYYAREKEKARIRAEAGSRSLEEFM